MTNPLPPIVPAQYEQLAAFEVLGVPAPQGVA